MIIYIYGNDTNKSKNYLRRVVDKFSKEKDPLGMNLVRLDAGNKDDVNRVFIEIGSSPFMAENRMVVISRLIFSGSKEFHELFDEKMEVGFPDSTIMVIWDEPSKPKANSSKTLYTKLTQLPHTKQFDLPKGVGMIKYMEVMARDYGLDLDREATLYIANNIDGQMDYLTHIMDQLVAYSGGQKLKEVDVRKFLPEMVGDSIFELIDLSMRGDMSTLYDRVWKQYETGQSTMSIMAMLIRQYRIMIEMRDLEDREGYIAPNILATRLSLHPFVIKKTQPFLQGMTMPILRNIYSSLLRLDYDIKTGMIEPKSGLDIFFGKLQLLQNVKTNKTSL